MTTKRPEHTTQELGELLASHDLRVTEQRLVVLGAMMHEFNDVTAQALHARLREQHPKLGLATVYRTLSTLAEAGVLDRLHHDDGGACYRYCAPGHHHHLVCRDCHAVVELRDCDLDSWAKKVARQHGFRQVEHTVELQGTCRSCSA
jgi:Fur family ferric uptake transcriptional regulator